jgi:predicted dehydrogenase
MNRPLRCAIIGNGVIAPAHIESYQLVPDVQVAWACDLVREKAEAMATRYGIPQVATDYHEVLADPTVDAVSICTDHGSHAQIAVDAFAAGKHVLCEKALAATTAGLDRMMKAHSEHPDRIFAAVFQNRFTPTYERLRLLIADGLLGTVLTANLQVYCLRTREYYQADRWRGTWADEGGSLMINQAIHFVDLLQWIGGGVTQVAANFANLTHGDAIETEDTVAAALTFRNGALGTISATTSSPHLQWEPTLSITGTAGTVEIRNGTVLRTVFDDAAKAQSVRELLDAPAEAGPDVAGKAYYGPGHSGIVADFVAAIREGRAPFIPGEDARAAVDIVLGIYQSHREGRRIAMP